MANNHRRGKKKKSKKVRRRSEPGNGNGHRTETTPHRSEGTCRNAHDDLPLGLIASFPANQKEPFRHRCVGCAYEAGFEAGWEAALSELGGHSENLSDDAASYLGDYATLPETD